MYAPNCTEKKFFASKIKKTALWNYKIEDLNESVIKNKFLRAGITESMKIYSNSGKFWN